MIRGLKCCVPQAVLETNGLTQLKFVLAITIDFPPSILDMIQELGHVAQNHAALVQNYSYRVYYSLGHFIYSFKCIHDPKEEVIDSTYMAEQVNDLMEVLQMIRSNNCCYFEERELLLGDPAKSQETAGKCNQCPNVSLC
eukprot:5805258-Ditylum_brightwellii.AAC.1